ncbi:multidrug resistance-associated ABC transporter [Phlegmacium glaucopus]|nr:multidrug resistance-associated ABC transporter [Phlegmacium glaucopus]
MVATTRFVVQAGPDWFSRPLASMESENLWKDTLLIPLITAVVSGTLLVAHALSYSWNNSRWNTAEDTCSTSVATNEESRSTRFGHKINQQTRNHGGLIIFAFKIARLMGCLALFALSLATLLLHPGRSTHQGLILDRDRVFLVDNLSQVAMAVTFLYTSLLATISLVQNSWSRSVTRHNNLVLFVALSVYVYRDIWPLATYTQKPGDLSEGTLLWTKVIVLFITAAVIPLLIPRQYVPVDPKHPMEVPNPEQTASILSLIMYSFLDPLIFEACRVPHLSHERLPAIPDYDYAEYLRKTAFPLLDPFQGAKGHLFFRLIRVFYVEYIWMSFAIIVQVLASFASPLAINQVLHFIESGGEGASITPWIWVLCLFIGPIVLSISSQWYLFMSTRAHACTESLLTQLVFEHSLRIRFKAEGSTEDSPSESQSVEGSTIFEGSDTQSDTTSSTKGEEKKGHKRDNLIGRINTLVTVDLDNVGAAKDFLMVGLQVPLELCLAVIFLYVVLGWSAFVGFASVILLLPAPGYVAAKMQSVQDTKMKMTDARIQTVSETLGVLRMVKLFGWEHKMSETINEKREEELKWIWKDKVIVLLTDLTNFIIPTITMLVTYGTYTLIMKESLNASKVFSSMAVFEVVRTVLHRTSYLFTLTLKGKVSLDRFSSFLGDTELLDSFSEDVMNDVQHDIDDDRIGFNDAVFAWSEEAGDGSLTPSSRSFRLRVEGKITFKRGCINLIVGPTGSGKTSILMALLGEMHFIPSTVDSWYNLPRQGGVAYAAQESWVQNETIRENILFGSPYDEERYQKVIYQCALTRDLELFEAGDSTEVGEKGLTLSGGQKARVTLARAIYSSAEIILLDDVLAALDVHTSSWIVDECLQGDLVRGRTVLLVTHNVALTAPIADFVVSIGLDGIPRDVGSNISAALESDPVLAREAEAEQEETEAAKQVIDTVDKEEQKSDGKLILAEEIVEGRITWKAIKLFLDGLGGEHPFLFMTLWVGVLLATQAAVSFAVWFLGYWGSQYDNHLPAQVPVLYYLSVYTLILVSFMFTYVMATTYYNIGTQRASRSINGQLIDSVLGSTLRWLDETPASRIITRCTQDIATVDTGLPWNLAGVVEVLTAMVIKLAAPVLFTPIFLLPGILIAALGVYLGNVYLRAQMSVKREKSNAKSPLLSHFAAAIAGLVSIRAYGAQQSFRTESMKRLNHYVKVSRTSFNLNRWIGIRIDVLGATFTAALASYLLVNRSLNAANIGFSLNMALEFCTMILWLVRIYNDFEVQANSLERIQGYLEIEHEPKPTQAGIPPAAWPKSGELQVERLSARYSTTGPKVLHDLSFHVKSGERIGIVGRTGSGKSSLTLSLLRCILTEGNVYYDGIPTNKINLDALRSSITIIPQMPELLSGTLRRNLDPFEQNDDATLNDALRASGLFSLQTDADEARLTLDSDIASGGNNLSVGQRQIIALARAIVRNSKLLILDEATSAIDHKTDSVIQSTLRNELGADVTILTVAHRLQTIMDADKIMVLDSGKIIEFDSPQELLQKKGGAFKTMVDGSGDKKALYAMADRKSDRSI